MTSRIIHSGRWPDLRKASTTLRRLAAFRRRIWLVSVRMTMRSSSESSSTSMRASSSLIASAPILATNDLAAVLVAQLAEALLGEQLLLLELGVARIDDDVALEVEDPLQVAQGDVEEVADAATAAP